MMDNQSENRNPSNGQTQEKTDNYTVGSSLPAFSGAFDDDSQRQSIDTSGQPVPQQYAPSMYGQPVPQQYAPPMYGQPVPQQYAPPMYGQPVPQQYAPMYAQPVVPKEVFDKKMFRKHCTRVGLMLMADQGLMFAVQIVVVLVAAVVLAVVNHGFASNDPTQLVGSLLTPVMLAGGLSAIAGNMLPSALHLRKWQYRFTDPFKGDKLSPGFVLVALLTALGLNSAWCYFYYYAKAWLDDFIGIHPDTAETIYTPETMPLAGMIFMLLWICVIAPVTEEYMFRGAMLKTLSKYGAGFGIVASAFAFGLMHGNLTQTPMAFLIGLVMGYVAAKSGNIRQTIFIHIVNNVIASLPQILRYFLPGWLGYYERYVEYFDYFTMIFAGFALIWFVVRRSSGLSARRQREAFELERISGAERAWMRLEIPAERRLPQLGSVRHKFCHFLTSGGMIFFEAVCLFTILVYTLYPYITGKPVGGFGF